MDDDRPKPQKVPNAYWTGVVEGLAGFAGQLRASWYGERSDDFYYERHQLEKYVQPFFYGPGVALAVFLGFRLQTNRTFQSLLRRRSKSESVVAEDPFLQHRNFLERERIAREKAAFESVRTLTDILVSISVGTSATLFLLERQHATLRQDMETAPLLPGRSLLADNMCPELRKVVQSHPIHTEDGQSLSTNLRSFQLFLEHCRLRNEREQQIRTLVGKPAGEPVSLPYPGVLVEDNDNDSDDDSNNSSSDDASVADTDSRS